LIRCYLRIEGEIPMLGTTRFYELSGQVIMKLL
jgi:hypothetical protein